MEDSRKQFESWFHARYDQISMPPGERIKLFTFSWSSWQASRSVIELVLPDCDKYEATWQYQDAAEEVLRAAGLKIKE